jgi:hypothetical protein
VTVTNDGLPEGQDPWYAQDPASDKPIDGTAQVPGELILPGLLPEEFWASRTVFQHIRNAAHARICSGDVLFWATMARLSGMLPHYIRAETGIGVRASLNIFAASVGKSGTGKSSGAALARGLMPTPLDLDFRDGIPPGSGEGIPEVFIEAVQEDTNKTDSKGKKIYKTVRKQVRHNAYIYIDEGALLTKLGQRSGATIDETLRSAAMGQQLGSTNASEDRKRQIDPETYSLGMFVGYQPKTAIPLLADGGTGSPQRFFWSWVLDPSIPDIAPAYPGAIRNHPAYKHRELRKPLDITFPKWIRDEMHEYKRAVGRGDIEPDELDGHASIMKTKLAAMFALLDDRIEVDDKDWELAGIAWRCSCEVRNSLIASAQRQAREIQELQDEAAVNLAVRTHEAKSDADRRLERIAQGVLRHTVKAALEGITRGGLRKCFSGDDKPYVQQAIDLAIAKAWVFEDEGRIYARTKEGERGR